jgi:hypothetical protein
MRAALASPWTPSCEWVQHLALLEEFPMAKAQMRDVTKTVARRAKATAGRVRKGGKAAAAQLAHTATALAGRKDVKRAVKRVKKTAARAKSDVKALASKAAAKLTGRPKPSRAKRVAKVALAAAGAAAVAAAGVGLARTRKR